MTKASDNAFPSILLTEGTEPSAPAAGKQRLYVDSTTHVLMIVNSSGTESAVATAGAMATDALWDAAGDLAVGTGANTAAKLTKGIAGAQLAMYNGTVTWNGGTSFPGSPATGDRYWRTDLLLDFYYDGTRWVTTTLYHHANSFQNTAVGTAYPGITSSISEVSLGVPRLGGGSDLWLVGATMTFLVSGGTALSGSHKWVTVFSKSPTDNSNTTVLTFTVDSGSSGVWRQDAQAIGALLNNGTVHYAYKLDSTKTGTPGTYFTYIDITYRVVAV